METVLLTTGRAAKQAGVSVDTVRRWLHVGVPMYGRVEFLAGYQIGSHWRIRETELTRFLTAIQTTQRAKSAVCNDAKPIPGRGSAALAQALQSIRRGKSARGRASLFPPRISAEEIQSTTQ